MSRFPLVTLTPSPAAHAPAKWVITAHQAPRERGRKQKGHFSPRANKQQNTFSAVVLINGLWFKVLKVSCTRHHLSCRSELRNQLQVTVLPNPWQIPELQHLQRAFLCLS